MSDGAASSRVRQEPGGPDPRDPARAAVRIDVGLTEEPLDLLAAVAAVRDDTCGGYGVFLGTVRDHHEGDAVRGLTYEAWEDEAVPAMERLARAAGERFPSVRGLHVRHRLGALHVGEDAIVVAVSAPHRAPAMDAAAWLVDAVKAGVPVWKQEQLVDGGHRWPGLDTGASPSG
jgi:molybdopterin synthase catalytic subunit